MNTVAGKPKEPNSVSLWSRIKANCLDENPYISQAEDGREIVICPRCHEKQPSMEFTTFSMEPQAVAWLVPVQKCPHCHHIFAFVR